VVVHYTTEFDFASSSECIWLHDVPDFFLYVSSTTMMMRNEVI